MSTLHIALAAISWIAYLFSWAGYSKYQFIERDSIDPAIKADANAKWHRFKFVNQVAYFGVFGLLISGIWAITAAIGFQIIFNSMLNVFALKQPVYHLGNNSIDKFMKNTFGEKIAYVILLALFAGLVVVSIIFPNLLSF